MVAKEMSCGLCFMIYRDPRFAMEFCDSGTSTITTNPRRIPGCSLVSIGGHTDVVLHLLVSEVHVVAVFLRDIDISSGCFICFVR